jgi:anti-sigma factor RsiW
MDCKAADKLIDVYLDGELADVDRLEMAAHVAACAGCARQLQELDGLRALLRAATPTETSLEHRQALEGRIRARLEAEPSRGGMRHLWLAIPATAAAAVGLFAPALWHTPSTRNGETDLVSEVVNDSLDRHRRNLPVEVPGPDALNVAQWFRDKVDIPVRPPRLAPAHGDLVGGRLSHIRDKQAAYLMYSVDGSKVSVFIFDPATLPPPRDQRPAAQGGGRHLARVRDHEVYVDEERGHHVALFRDHGLGYAFASEMDEPQLLELVATSLAPPEPRVAAAPTPPPYERAQALSTVDPHVEPDYADELDAEPAQSATPMERDAGSARSPVPLWEPLYPRARSRAYPARPAPPVSRATPGDYMPASFSASGAPR